MSKKYSKADLRHIAEGMIEELRECENDFVTTTGRLARSYGYDDMDMSDLFGLHEALFRVAKANKITLDMSEHEGKVEGLPFNLDFVVRNRKAQIKCPYCGSKNTARILYGLPAFSDELEEKLKEGKLVLGGCCIDAISVNGEHVQTDPARKCNDCGREFGTPPLIIAKDRSSAEDYRDIVRSIEFEIGGYFQGFRKIKLTKNEKGALVQTETTEFGKTPYTEKQITVQKRNRILNELYCHMYLHEWKKNYDNPEVLDGESWSLTIKLPGRRERNYGGINAYPPYWSELKKLFREFGSGKIPDNSQEV